MREVRIANTIGMVITQSGWDISAMLAPVRGSPPYASGNTTVLRPRADAVEKNARKT